MKRILLILFGLLPLCGISQSHQKALLQLEKQAKRYGEIAQNIWAFAEVGYQEQIIKELYLNQ